jgi:DNA-binding Xre family transcriptional regulator
MSELRRPRHGPDVVADDDNGTFGPVTRRGLLSGKGGLQPLPAARDAIFVSSNKPRFGPASRIRPKAFDEMLLERGLSLSEFQKQSGIARSTLERARRGEPLTTNTLLRISDTLDRIPVRTTILRLLGREAT